MLLLQPETSEWTMLTSRSELQLRTMSGSTVFQQPGSVLTYEAWVATKGHTKVSGLGHNLWSY